MILLRYIQNFRLCIMYIRAYVHAIYRYISFFGVSHSLKHEFEKKKVQNYTQKSNLVFVTL